MLRLSQTLQRQQPPLHSTRALSHFEANTTTQHFVIILIPILIVIIIPIIFIHGLDKKASWCKILAVDGHCFSHFQNVYHLRLMAKGTQDPGLKQVANFPTNVSSATRWPNAICAKHSTQGNQVNSILVKKTGCVVSLAIFYKKHCLWSVSGEGDSQQVVSQQVREETAFCEVARKRFHANSLTPNILPAFHFFSFFFIADLLFSPALAVSTSIPNLVTNILKFRIQNANSLFQCMFFVREGQRRLKNLNSNPESHKEMYSKRLMSRIICAASKFSHKMLFYSRSNRHCPMQCTATEQR